MFRSIDIKSMLIGGLLVLVILLLVGAVPVVQPDEYGRFRIATNDSHAFILDTATGQVWSSMFIGPQFGTTPSPDPSFHAPKTSN